MVAPRPFWRARRAASCRANEATRGLGALTRRGSLYDHTMVDHATVIVADLLMIALVTYVFVVIWVWSVWEIRWRVDGVPDPPPGRVYAVDTADAPLWLRYFGLLDVIDPVLRRAAALGARLASWAGEWAYALLFAGVAWVCDRAAAAIPVAGAGGHAPRPWRVLVAAGRADAPCAGRDLVMLAHRAGASVGPRVWWLTRLAGIVLWWSIWLVWLCLRFVAQRRVVRACPPRILPVIWEFVDLFAPLDEPQLRLVTAPPAPAACAGPAQAPPTPPPPVQQAPPTPPPVPPVQQAPPTPPPAPPVQQVPPTPPPAPPVQQVPPTPPPAPPVQQAPPTPPPAPPVQGERAAVLEHIRGGRPLAVRVVGPVRIDIRGHNGDVGDVDVPARLAQVMAQIAVHDDGDRRALAAAQWPDMAPSAGRDRLAKYVSRLVTDSLTQSILASGLRAQAETAERYAHRSILRTRTTIRLDARRWATDIELWRELRGIAAALADLADLYDDDYIALGAHPEARRHHPALRRRHRELLLQLRPLPRPPVFDDAVEAAIAAIFGGFAIDWEIACFADFGELLADEVEFRVALAAGEFGDSARSARKVGAWVSYVAAGLVRGEPFAGWQYPWVAAAREEIQREIDAGLLEALELARTAGYPLDDLIVARGRLRGGP